MSNYLMLTETGDIEFKVTSNQVIDAIYNTACKVGNKSTVLTAILHLLLMADRVGELTRIDVQFMAMAMKVNRDIEARLITMKEAIELNDSKLGVCQYLRRYGNEIFDELYEMMVVVWSSGRTLKLLEVIKGAANEIVLMLISDHVYGLLEYEGVVRDVGKIVASTVQDQNTPEGPTELNQEYYIASKKHEQFVLQLAENQSLISEMSKIMVKEMTKLIFGPLSMGSELKKKKHKKQVESMQTHESLNVKELLMDIIDVVRMMHLIESKEVDMLVEIIAESIVHDIKNEVTDIRAANEELTIRTEGMLNREGKHTQELLKEARKLVRKVLGNSKLSPEDSIENRFVADLTEEYVKIIRESAIMKTLRLSSENKIKLLVKIYVIESIGQIETLDKTNVKAVSNLVKRLERVGVLEQKVLSKMKKVLESAEKLYLTVNGIVAFMVKTPRLIEELLMEKDVIQLKQIDSVELKGRDQFLKNQVVRTSSIKSSEVINKSNDEVRRGAGHVEQMAVGPNEESSLVIDQLIEKDIVNELEQLTKGPELNLIQEQATEVVRTEVVRRSGSIIDGLGKVIKMQADGKMVARSVTVCNIPIAMTQSALFKDMTWMLNNRRMTFDNNKLEDKIYGTKWREKVNRSHCSITIELLVPTTFHFGISDIGHVKKYFCIMPGIKRQNKQALYMIQPCRPEFTAEEGGKATGSHEVFKIRGVLNSEGSVNAILRAVKSYMASKTRLLNIPKVELCVEIESFYIKGTLNHETCIAVMLKKNGSSTSDRNRLRTEVLQGQDPVAKSIIVTISGWMLWISESKSRVDPPEVVNKVYFTTQLTRIIPTLTLEQVLEVISKEQPSVVTKIEDAFYNWQTFLNPTLYILWNQEPELIALKAIDAVCS